MVPEEDSEWSTQIDEVWVWDEWPERWSADKGIDLSFATGTARTDLSRHSDNHFLVIFV